MAKLIHHAPTYNADTHKWDVKITNENGRYVRTQEGFDTKTDGHEWSMQQAINSVVSTASQELPESEKTKISGSSRLSL